MEVTMDSNGKGSVFVKDTKRLDVICTCMVYYTGSIEVPAEAGKLLGIQVLDHIILGEGDDFYSLRESGGLI